MTKSSKTALFVLIGVVLVSGLAIGTASAELSNNPSVEQVNNSSDDTNSTNETDTTDDSDSTNETDTTDDSDSTNETDTTDDSDSTNETDTTDDSDSTNETDTTDDSDSTNETDSSEESESQSDSEQEETTQDDTAAEAETCEGPPQMSRTSITSPQNQITTDSPAVIEANFRVDPTIPEECTVMADLQYTFSQNGFQFAGGSDWEQAASDIAVTTFEVNPGEIRSIDAEIYTNGAEAGDEVTVVADYELWYEGDRENSRQISGQRNTLTVDSPNDEPDESDGGSSDDDGTDDGSTGDGAPGFGIVSILAAITGFGYLVNKQN